MFDKVLDDVLQSIAKRLNGGHEITDDVIADHIRKAAKKNEVIIPDMVRNAWIVYIRQKVGTYKALQNVHNLSSFGKPDFLANPELHSPDLMEKKARDLQDALVNAVEQLRREKYLFEQMQENTI